MHFSAAWTAGRGLPLQFLTQTVLPVGGDATRLQQKCLTPAVLFWLQKRFHTPNTLTSLLSPSAYLVWLFNTVWLFQHFVTLVTQKLSLSNAVRTPAVLPDSKKGFLLSYLWEAVLSDSNKGVLLQLCYSDSNKGFLLRLSYLLAVCSQTPAKVPNSSCAILTPTKVSYSGWVTCGGQRCYQTPTKVSNSSGAILTLKKVSYSDCVTSGRRSYQTPTKVPNSSCAFLTPTKVSYVTCWWRCSQTSAKVPNSSCAILTPKKGPNSSYMTAAKLPDSNEDSKLWLSYWLGSTPRLKPAVRAAKRATWFQRCSLNFNKGSYTGWATWLRPVLIDSNKRFQTQA